MPIAVAVAMALIQKCRRHGVELGLLPGRSIVFIYGRCVVGRVPLILMGVGWPVWGDTVIHLPFGEFFFSNLGTNIGKTLTGWMVPIWHFFSGKW